VPPPDEGREPPGPLQGVRVVALEQSVSGPLASRLLADMGADVIKVEPPQGDFSRHWDAHVRGQSSYYTWLSRRKRSIALDLHGGDDRQTFERLLDGADILVFNMAVMAAERAGLTPERLRIDHPRLIACQITGYGRTGRSRNRRAYDMMVQAEAGALALTGDDQGPVRIGISVADIGTGLYATSLILAALFGREASGTGAFLEVSMFETLTEFAGPNLTAFANSGVEHGRYRARHHAIVPYGVFACQDGHLAIAVEQDSEWRRFCDEVLERPDLGVRDDLSTNHKRLERRSETENIVEAELMRKPAGHWQARLEAAGIAFGSINDIKAVWNHPVEEDLSLHGRARLPDGELVSVPRSAAERAFGRGTRDSPLPGLDQHRAEIFSELDGEAGS